jgi:hypothetical protein
MPEATGLADMLWRYSQGHILTHAELTQLDSIIIALQGRLIVLQDVPRVARTMP